MASPAWAIDDPAQDSIVGALKVRGRFEGAWDVASFTADKDRSVQFQSGPTRNRLLASLPIPALGDLLAKLKPIRLESQRQLYSAGKPMESVYFVETGMISLVASLEDGVSVEVGIVGREGMLGAPLASENDIASFDAMVQIPGAALRMGASDFKSELAASTPLRRLLLRYHEALYVEAMQAAACNAHHKLERRLARWLLAAHDRVDGDEVPLSQEFLATMLGVHRPSVTVAARALQRAGLIRHSFGLVNILDRPGLEAAACECYAVTSRWTSSLLEQTI